MPYTYFNVNIIPKGKAVTGSSKTANFAFLFILS